MNSNIEVYITKASLLSNKNETIGFDPRAIYSRSKQIHCLSGTIRAEVGIDNAVSILIVQELTFKSGIFTINVTMSVWMWYYAEAFIF